MPLNVILDQDERNVCVLQLYNHFRRDVAVIRNDQPLHALCQVGLYRVQTFVVPVIHVQQHLVAKPLRLSLKAANDISIENIQQCVHRTLFDQ